MDDYLKILEDDDEELILGLDCWLYAMVRSKRPPLELFVIRIKNWFDHKWLGFAGKGKILMDTGLDEINSEMRGYWKSGNNVTIPPFSPKRVVEEFYFKRQENGNFIYQGSNSKLIHPVNRQRSANNLKNRVIDISQEGLFIWLSSHSFSSQRASMLIYQTFGDQLAGWYASFAKKKIWNVEHTKNMDRALFSRIFSKSLKAMST